MGRPSKQQQIVQAARRLFVERGYQGTSIELVVQQAGVSKPTIYNHYPNKQAMLVYMLNELKSELESLISAAEATASHGDLAAAVRLFRSLTAHTELLAAFRIRIGEAHELEATTIQRFETLDEMIGQWFDGWFSDAGQARRRFAIVRSEILLAALLEQSGPSDDELNLLLRD